MGVEKQGIDFVNSDIKKIDSYSSKQLSTELGNDLEETIDKFFLNKKINTLQISKNDLSNLKEKLTEKSNDKEKQIELLNSFLEEKSFIKLETQNGIAVVKSGTKKTPVKEVREDAYKKIDNLKFMGLIPIPEFVSKSLKDQVDKKTMTKQELQEKEKKENEGKDWDDKILDNLGKTFSTIIGAGFLSLFKDDLPELDSIGVSEIPEELEDTVDKVKQTGTGIVTGAGKLKEEESKTEKKEGEEKDKEKKEKEKSDVNYSIGINMLINLSGKEITGNGNRKGILEKIKDLKFNELESLTEDKQQELGIKNETFEQIKKALISENVDKLINIGLKKDILEKIFKKNSKKLIDSFGQDRFNEIKEKTENNTLNVKNDLTLSEISILYLQTIPVLGIAGINNFAGDIAETVKGLTVGENDIQNYIDENIISKDILSNFASKGGLPFGNNEYINKDSEVLENVGSNLNENDKEQLDSLISFKEYIKNGFVQENKLGLPDDVKSLFLENLNYKYVITFYTILGGEHNLENLNPVNIPILVELICQVAGGKNNDYQNKSIVSKYKTDFYKNIVLSTEGKNIFTEEEKEVLDIYKDFFIGQSVNYYLGKLYGYSGYLNSLNENYSITIGTGAGAIALNSIGSSIIKNGLKKGGVSTFGLMFKRLSWPLFIASIVSGTSKVIGDGNFKIDGFFDDLKNSQNPEEAIKIMEEHEKGVKEYKDSKGESIKLVKYKDDAPYIIYKNQIWKIGVLYTGLKDDLIPDIIAKPYTIIDGVDTKKIKVEGESIIIGDGIQKEVNGDTFEGNEMKLEQNESIINKGGLELPDWAKGNNEIKEYIKIGEVNKDTPIIIYSIGEVKLDKKETN